MKIYHCEDSLEGIFTAICRSKAMQNDRLTAAEGEENRNSGR